MSFKRPIQRLQKTLVLLFATDDNQIISPAFELNGRIRRVVFTLPNLDGTDTGTVTILDADGQTVYTKATVAESTSSNETTDLAVAGLHTIQIDTSGAQTANKTFYVTIVIDKG